MKKSLKPRLAAGKVIEVAPGSGPGLAESNKALQVGTVKEPVLRRGVRTMAQLLVLTIVLAVSVGAILSATVMVALPSGDGRMALTLRGAYSLGSVPAGATMYASSQPATQDALGHLSDAVTGVPGGSVVKIIAGPNAKVTSKGGEILADGKPTGVRAKVDPVGLDREYVALCLSGSGCTPGTAVIIPQGNLIGAVKGFIAGSGYTPVANPAVS